MVGKKLEVHIENLETKMLECASKLNFEEAAKLRDQINRLKAEQIGVPNPLAKKKIKKYKS